MEDKQARLQKPAVCELRQAFFWDEWLGTRRRGKPRLRAFSGPARCNARSSFSPTKPTRFQKWKSRKRKWLVYLELLVYSAAVAVDVRQVERPEVGVKVLVNELIVDTEVMSVCGAFWLGFQRREV